VSGELILNFLKVRNPITIAIADVGGDAVGMIRNVAELTIVKNDGASTDDIYCELIPKLLDNGLLSEVKHKIKDITPILAEQFIYDKDSELWRIRPNTKLGSAIPLESRVRFYILDYLRRSERQNKKITLDDIVQDVLPNLVNGEQPTERTILEELRKVAVPQGNKYWRLHEGKEPQIDLGLVYPEDRIIPSLKKSAKEYSHSEIIVLLSRLAQHSKFTPVIGKRERATEALNVSLAKIGGNLSLDDVDSYNRKKIEQIDCIWSLKGIPKIAFEIEMSTAITSGIERFASLLELFPKTAGNLVIVVPGSRWRKLNEVLFKSAYVGHPLFMENKLKYLYIDDLVALYNEFAKRKFLNTESAQNLLNGFLKSPESLIR
jgi:hypothetical protein